MKYMLDTNICIYLIKNKPVQVLEKFKLFSVGEIGISSITFSELEYGVEKSQSVEKNRKALEQFTVLLEVVPFEIKAAQSYGKIRAELEKKGTPVGPLDLLIAAHAKSLGVTLVTNNIKEFKRISGLKIENWV